jgi:type VI secretion system protein ImpF
MSELSLRERLQPALFDRLVDEERLLVQYEIHVSRAELRRIGIPERDLVEILRAQGLARDEKAVSPAADDALRLRFSAPYGRVNLSQLKALTLTPPAARQGVALQSFCKIEAQTVTNDTAESSERRFASMRRLREYVCRDLAWLLNSTGIDETVDLARYPEVQRSVLNYGMPSLAGRAAVAVDVAGTARAIEEVIRRFEPRLTHVRVTPDVERGGDGHQLSFRIEADLWGQPAAQHLVLRTQISTESGDVSVAESGNR